MRLTTSAAIWLASERANPMLLGCVGGSVPPLAIWSGQQSDLNQRLRVSPVAQPLSYATRICLVPDAWN